MYQGFDSQTAVVEFVGRGSRASARAGCFLGVLFFVFSAANLVVGTRDTTSQWVFIVVGSLGVFLLVGGVIGKRFCHTPAFVLRFEVDGLRWGKAGSLSEPVRYGNVARIYCYWQDVTAASFQFEFRGGDLQRVRVYGFSDVDLAKIADEMKRRFACPVEQW